MCAPRALISTLFRWINARGRKLRHPEMARLSSELLLGLKHLHDNGSPWRHDQLVMEIEDRSILAW